MSDGKTPEIVIRFATAGDGPALQAIFNHEVESSTASLEWYPLAGEDWQRWLFEHTRDNHVLLVAEVAGAVAGFAGYGAFRTKAGYVDTVEDSVFIKEAYRGHGLGKRLLRRLLAEARDRGIHAVVAAVIAENVVSVGLHHAVGFVDVAYLPQVGHKFGRWVDLQLLQIILDNRPTP
ncbi:MAG: GNAT family N-acetyltransferase [Propionibacteriaceae bacterium]|nr:GNAT family N-acetyltransferase [Propionibacteriaceae bacterium]